MPTAAPTPCRHPGCAAVLATPGYCERHRRLVRKAQDERRGSAAARGYGARWRKARDLYLSRHPLCAECRRQGRTVAASVVDHVVPHKGNRTIFWDERNWQALCKPCHDTKTAREDGGFGRPGKQPAAR